MRRQEVVVARVLSLIFLPAAMLVVFGCLQPQPTEPPNILLISIDTLRADHLGCYGYERDTSPILDSIAARGTLFSNCTSTSPWTLPAHASLLTGLHPVNHQVVGHEFRLSPAIPTLASKLRTAGFKTAAFVNSQNVGEKYGLRRGFDDFEFTQPRTKSSRRDPGVADPSRQAQGQVSRAIAWLEDKADDRFFLFLHNYDVHSSYDPSPHFRQLFDSGTNSTVDGSTNELMRIRDGKEVSTDDLQRLVDLYDGGIRELDAELGRLITFLEERDLLARTVVVITSDHGEEFMEHGGVLHGRTMHRELLHIPLIISGPGVPDGVANNEPTQLTDIFPTLLRLAMIDDLPPVDGLNLITDRNKLNDIADERNLFAEADHNREIGDNTLQMVRSGKYKLIYERASGTSWLYDINRDPGEATDLADRLPEVVHRLVGTLDDRPVRSLPAESIPPLTQQETKELEALGYVSAAATPGR